MDTTSTAVPVTTAPVSSALGIPAVPFRSASLGADGDSLKQLLDDSGISVDPYFDSCTSVDVTGWDPVAGDTDVFVSYSGSSPCPGDSLGRFFAIRGKKVVVQAAACGDCGSNGGPDADKYLAIHDELKGRKAVHGKVGGGARWSFDALDEVVLGAPSPPPAPVTTAPGVSTTGYLTADWGGASTPMDHPAFASPSGNIVCVFYEIDGGRVLCGVNSHAWTTPKQDCGPISFQGDIVQLSSTGVKQGICAGGIMVPIHAKALPYGSTLSDVGIECSSAETGVTCTHVASGHRFSVSRERLTGS